MTAARLRPSALGPLSLRLRITLVFVVINVLVWGGLLSYVFVEGRRIQKAFEASNDRLRERTQDAILAQLTQLLEIKIREKIATSHGKPITGLELQDISYWDEPAFRFYVRRAVVIQTYEEGGKDADVFHPRTGLIFGHREFDKEEAVRLVRRALDQNRVIIEGTHAAGQIRIGGLKTNNDRWGGVYLSIYDIKRDLPVYDPVQPLRQVTAIAVVGTLALVGVLYSFLARSVIRPLEEMGDVATAAAAGDYSQRVTVRRRRDEVGGVIEAVNRMLGLVEDYRANMERRVAENTAVIANKNRELMLAQRLVAMGTLAAGIAHEINNPLGGMLNALARLRRLDITPEQRDRYLTLLEENTARIGATVRKVLDLSPQRMVPGPVLMPDVVRRVFDLVRYQADRVGVRLELDETGPLPAVLGEANEVVQIILNLVLNAIDACNAGGEIRVRLRREGPWVAVDVCDDGTGMTPEVQTRAFDLFFTTKEAGKGTGLGLATVHNLVTNLGGTIDLESQPGKGTTFRLRFRAVDEGAST